MGRKPDTIKESLNLSITETLASLDNEIPGSQEYSQLIDQLRQLVDCREKLYPASKPADKGQVLTVVANLLGIGAIISYEHAHVIASKAFSMVAKLRI